MPYRVILGTGLLANAAGYARALAEGTARPGAYLARLLPEAGAALDADRMIELLLRTKLPQIFAESAVAADGSDWNATELGLLGDVSIATEVDVFDDGRHQGPALHNPPFRGTLVFTCGALLAGGAGGGMPDLAEVAPRGVVDQAAYDALYARRLRPVFAFIQAQATSRGRRAVVTVPGLGCGQFAGRFRGTLGPALQTALERLLHDIAPEIERIATVVYDPYDECADHATTFAATRFRVRPLRRSANPHPQLCRPADYAEDGEDAGDCDLYSLVAWDQVSWPGNDFYAGARATDDGVKAAATSSMLAITGVEGRYDPRRAMYQPPEPYRNWGDCVRSKGLTLALGDPFVQ
jgi:hypothetical protein